VARTCEDEESWDAELEAELAEPGPDERRWWALLTGSYGLSAAVHVAILLVLATILIAAPPEEAEAVILVSAPVVPPPPYDPERERDLERREEVPIPEQVEVPQVQLEEETPVTPKGTSWEHATNKELADHSVCDAYSLGGPGLSGAFGDRFGQGSLEAEGGGKETEDVLRAALLWLRDHQAADGRWACRDWTLSCGRRRKALPACQGPGRDPGQGSAEHDVGVSSLALLAFLGRGNTHRFGPFKESVRRGLRFLRDTQAPDGSIGFRGRGPTIYDHALATMAVCEAYAITRDPDLRGPAQRAVDFSLSAQNPGLGWRYGVRPGDNDTSVTGWFVLALKAARTGGLTVPDRAFADARAWLDRATDSRGATGYVAPGGQSAVLGANEAHFDPQPCMPAVGVVCRIFTGQRASEQVVRQGSRLLDEHRPAWAPRKLNFYYWYYGTYAQFQVGGAAWKRWNEDMKQALLPHQRRGGCEDGSWDPIDEWGGPGGRVYATAINALTLEIYYRYKRISELAGGKSARQG
jgi:hypothetical protein